MFLKYSTEGWLIYFHELVLNLICTSYEVSCIMYASMVSVLNPNVWMIASKNTLKFKQDKNISYPEPVFRFLSETKNLAIRKFMIHNHVQYHIHATWFIWRILIWAHLYTRYMCTVFQPPFPFLLRPLKSTIRGKLYYKYLKNLYPINTTLITFLIFLNCLTIQIVLKDVVLKRPCLGKAYVYCIWISSLFWKVLK